MEKEEDDITVAMTAAVDDAEDAEADMKLRLTKLRDDKVAGLAEEITQIKSAIARTDVDQKEACSVLLAMRLDIAKNITCDGTNASYVVDNSGLEFREYEGLFDDFHYDIGHGKGTGEGKVDKAPVRDGYGGQAPQSGPVGDYEVDVGAATRSWEDNLYVQPTRGNGRY